MRRLGISWRSLSKRCGVRIELFAGMLLGCVTFTACSAGMHPGDDVYWKDQRWDGMLSDAVQSVLHYPVDSAGQPIRPIPQTAQATVRFTYVDGKIQNPSIVESSGRADLDAAFLSQVAAAHVPAAHGSHAAEPHPIELVLEMPTPMQQFGVAEYTAINEVRTYPREAILEGTQGIATIEFKYFDGKAIDVAVAQSSGSIVLDKAAVSAVAHARLPPQPTWLPHEPLRMTVTICYSLWNSAICPRTRVVIEVTNSP